jgi:hypothetical protein
MLPPAEDSDAATAPGALAASTGQRQRPGHRTPGNRTPAKSAGQRLAELGRTGLARARRTPGWLWREHRLFTILAGLSVVPRVLAALGFRPALLSADSFLYMQTVVTGRLGVIRPSGYSFFLALVQGLPHALLVVTTVQHLMGIAIAALVYGLLRSWGLPAWGASLAAVPTLFDVREIALESYILPDTLFALVIMAVVALLLTRRTPTPGRCAAAGLLVAYACLIRGNGPPLAVVVAAFLLVRRVGWRAITAGVAAFAVPLLGYVLAFHAQYGTYGLTQSDGLFLWSRTTSFANCAVIKPPAALRPLCPGRERSVRITPGPPWSVPHLLAEPTPADYLWASDAWWRTDAHPGINRASNRLGRRFAIAAIEAQPGAYLRVVGRDILETFFATDRPQGTSYMTFTAAPRIAHLPRYYQHDERSYAGTTSNTHADDPYAFLMFWYQQSVIFPGVLFALVVLTGLAGVLRNWRRFGGPAALPWALAAVSIVSPALLTQSLYRYVIVAIPLAAVAAGLAFAPSARSPAPDRS